MRRAFPSQATAQPPFWLRSRALPGCISRRERAGVGHACAKRHSRPLAHYPATQPCKLTNDQH